MKNFLKILTVLVFLLMIQSSVLFGQVSINTDNSNPDSSALLDVKSTAKGILIPRMTSSQKNAISSPAVGLMVFQTTTPSGFYYYTGTAWVIVGSSDHSGGTMFDIEGNAYPTTQIGNQVWMAKNLKTRYYRNGNPIPEVKPYGEWTSTTSGAYCYYANDSAKYSEIYGALYNGFAVNNNLCPYGWHIPTYDEVDVLSNYLGYWSAGGKMKTNIYWQPPNAGELNKTGFSGFPGGFREDDGNFYQMGYSANFWEATNYSTTEIWIFTLDYEELIGNGVFTKNFGSSVRCVKD